jgi:uncharacterized membrane protein
MSESLAELKRVSPKKRFDWIPAFLAVILLSGFMTVIFALFKFIVPDGNKDTLYFMAGQLSVFTGMAIAYFYQTTQQSAHKTDIISKSGPVDPHS